MEGTELLGEVRRAAAERGVRLRDSIRSDEDVYRMIGEVIGPEFGISTRARARQVAMKVAVQAVYHLMEAWYLLGTLKKQGFPVRRTLEDLASRFFEEDEYGGFIDVDGMGNSTRASLPLGPSSSKIGRRIVGKSFSSEK